MGFLFGSSQQEAATTTVTAPTRMPTTNSAVVRNAAAKKNQDIFGRSGRRSTVLSRRDGEPGTASYSNSLLGQAG